MITYQRKVLYMVKIIKNNTFFYGSLLLLECFFWGTGNPIIKIAMKDIMLFYGLTIRFAIAFMIFLALYGKRFVKEMRRQYLIPGIIISFFTTFVFATSYLALLNTSSTIAGFLMGMAVIFTPLLARFFLGTRINPILILPITLVIIGMYYLCGATGTFSFKAGEFYALLSSASCACMLVASSKYITNDVNPFVMSVMQTGMIALYCLPLALLFEEAPVLSSISFLDWLAILYLAAACSCAAYIIQNTALSKVPSTYVALIFCSEPLFTAIMSYFILGEVLNSRGFFGAVLITISIALASITPDEYNYRTSPMRIGRIRIKKAIRHIIRNARRH